MRQLPRSPVHNINSCSPQQVNQGDCGSLIFPWKKQFVSHNNEYVTSRNLVTWENLEGKKWEEGEKRGRITGNREGEKQRLRSWSFFFLQVGNVIKGIFDLVLILSCGCYLLRQHDEKSPFCWWNRTLILVILVQKHSLLYNNTLPHRNQNSNHLFHTHADTEMRRVCAALQNWKEVLCT